MENAQLEPFLFGQPVRLPKARQRAIAQWAVMCGMVTEWTLRGTSPRRPEVNLPDDWDAAAPDAHAEWEADYDLAALFSDLPARQRQVLDLRYRLGLSPAEIATKLGIHPNAVHQALHNGHRKLSEKFVD